jgi:hypothetical protein
MSGLPKLKDLNPKISTWWYVVLTDVDDAEFGRLLIEVLRELHINELNVHLVGFRIGCNLPYIIMLHGATQCSQWQDPAL